MPLPMWYHAKFSRSALKGIGINTAEHQKLGSFELCSLEAWLPLPHVTKTNLVVLQQRVYT